LSLDIRREIDQIFQLEGRRVLATLIRLLGDFDSAEDALHDAFSIALARWPKDGIPENPRAWLISTGRFKGIDSLRKRVRASASLNDVREASDTTDFDLSEEAVKDDQLRLIFTCCHPALAPEARSALTLREVCGLTTEEIAHAYLTSAPTIAQRIVRAKSKIRDAKIPYQVPDADDLPERLETVLQVIYLVFNEGYFASSGESLVRADLSGEAIRLGRHLAGLLPEPEVMGLLALMLLQESRRQARVSSEGDLILLEEQDRTLWDRTLIAEGVVLVERALLSRRGGPYSIQAAIAAIHSEAQSSDQTDWGQIVALYDILLGLNPNPVVELNRAVAVAMARGPAEGLALIDALFERGDLADYPLAHSARGELARRLGRREEARTSLSRALELATQEPERRFLKEKIATL
jgi:RNA polymerase sigma-70 factor (ECF subfamily)